MKRLRRIAGWSALIIGALVALALAAPGLKLIDSVPLRLFDADGRSRVAAVFVSGDMGLGYGLGKQVAPALAARGIPVLGVSSPVQFGTRRTRAEVDGVIADAIRQALARTGADRVVLMGQSFGADMVAVAAPDLPAELRRRVAAIALVVPGNTAFFRADPTDLTYLGTPDARPAAGMRALRWAPVICVWGVAERDSLCPELAGSAARTIALPGGHFLRNDSRLLVTTLVRELRAADPALLASKD
ncbi:AcvB/VirJ family lysyl-phosphatidylglycerol hydrolase [Sphingomonas sp. Y38-1Y]|uniref:AcvB/VirJ family lysyl-phosphatidylglycerol hydrolase n=1 Tax=Sphingomonas sp. Y38-1Y TaxID=3078265 RepID=UPI0028EE7DD4|nr:AcvB/VirJ family lysyl-phosphatidylglycerol hydrolase [Sphingomonas sp. Y38-1Y]